MRIYVRFSHFTCVGEMQVTDLHKNKHFDINSLFFSVDPLWISSDEH